MQPLVGLGVDAQYSADYPLGLKDLLRRLEDRLSHVSVSVIESEAQAREFVANVCPRIPLLHHLSRVAPGDPDGPHAARMTLLNAISHILRARWTNEDIGLWSLGAYGIPYFAPPIFDRAIAKTIAERVGAILSLNDLPLLLEVPPCSYTVGDMPLGEFFTYLVETTGCEMTLDISHVFSFGVSSGQSYERVLASLPVTRVREIHIAGGKLSRVDSRRYIDTHSDPILEPVLDIVEQTLAACPNARAVTYEIMPGLALDSLERGIDALQHRLARSGFVPDFENAHA